MSFPPSVGDVGKWLSGANKSIMGRADYKPPERTLDDRMSLQDRQRDQLYGAKQEKQALTLERRALGVGGPSVAELQGQRGLGQVLAQQQAAANSARGANRAMMLRNAQLGGVQAQAQTSMDSAILRAQEQQQAEQTLAQQMAAMRQQQQGMRGQDLMSAQSNLAAGLSRDQMMTALAQGNAERGQKGAGTYMSAGSALIGGLMGLSDMRAKESVLPIQDYGDFKQRLDAYGAAQPTEQQSGWMLGRSLGQLSHMLSDENSKARIMELERDNAALRGATTPEASREDLAPLKPYEYIYKPEAAASVGMGMQDAQRPREGVMAQDMLKSPAGAAVVDRAPNGMLALDPMRALQFSLGELGGIDKRLKRLEGSSRK